MTHNEESAQRNRLWLESLTKNKNETNELRYKLSKAKNIDEDLVQRQMDCIERLTNIKQEFVLQTSNPEVKEAYHSMMLNKLKTIG